MAVISELIIDGENITNHEHSTISTISADGVDYNFAKPHEVLDGVCENAVNEPIINMQLGGNSVQNGTPTTETPIEIESVGIYDEATGKYKVPIKTNETTTDIYLAEPLRKIGDYADYIDYKNKKVIRKIGGAFITSVQTKSSSSNTYPVFLSTISKKPLVSNSKSPAMSNKFISHEEEYWALGIKNGGYIQGYTSSSGVDYVMYSFKDTTINTIELAEEAIGDGFEAIYILATPTEETIEVPEISTLKGTTIFDTDTTAKPSEIKINYWKQI